MQLNNIMPLLKSIQGYFLNYLLSTLGFPGGASGKESTCAHEGDVRDMGSIPGSEDSL